MSALELFLLTRTRTFGDIFGTAWVDTSGPAVSSLHPATHPIQESPAKPGSTTKLAGERKTDTRDREREGERKREGESVYHREVVPVDTPVTTQLSYSIWNRAGEGGWEYEGLSNYLNKPNIA